MANRQVITVWSPIEVAAIKATDVVNDSYTRLYNVMFYTLKYDWWLYEKYVVFRINVNK